jgi:hypothetical protein
MKKLLLILWLQFLLGLLPSSAALANPIAPRDPIPPEQMPEETQRHEQQKRAIIILIAGPILGGVIIGSIVLRNRSRGN